MLGCYKFENLKFIPKTVQISRTSLGQIPVSIAMLVPIRQAKAVWSAFHVAWVNSPRRVALL